MPKQMKGGSFRVSPAKAGTKVARMTKAPRELFMPRQQGIVAHGQIERVESQGEQKDRLVG